MKTAVKIFFGLSVDLELKVEKQHYSDLDKQDSVPKLFFLQPTEFSG